MGLGLGETKEREGGCGGRRREWRRLLRSSTNQYLVLENKILQQLAEEGELANYINCIFSDIFKAFDGAHTSSSGRRKKSIFT